MRNDFTSFGIAFYWAGIEGFDLEYIDSDYYYVGYNKTRWDTELIQENPHDDAIDIYILSKSGRSLGNAVTIPSTHFYVTGMNYIPSSVFSHEMAHCLGVYHTYESGGDGLPDTDTPTHGVEILHHVDPNTCNYYDDEPPPEIEDPDDILPTNIMAGTHPWCMLSFTPGQKSIMNNSLRDEAILQPVLLQSKSITLSNLEYQNPTNNLNGELRYNAYITTAVGFGGSIGSGNDAEGFESQLIRISTKAEIIEDEFSVSRKHIYWDNTRKNYLLDRGNVIILTQTTHDAFFAHQT